MRTYALSAIIILLMLSKKTKNFLMRLAIFLGVPVVLFAGLQLLFSWPSLTNPAKGLSNVAVTFAKAEGLIQMKEYNGAATGFDNTIPFYIHIYRGTGSIDELEPKYKAALSSAGYAVEEAYFTYDTNCPFTTSGPGCPQDRLQGYTVNGGQPYWVLRGKNSAGDTFSSELSTLTYYDATNTLDFGEHPVPSGSFVLTTSFVSHKTLH